MLIGIVIFSYGIVMAGETVYPPKEWKDEPNPLASPFAVIGGELSIFAGQEPKSFNYYLDNNSFSAELFGGMYETLLNTNPITLEYEPGLASQWTISDDKKVFTFFIDKRAKWSDGKPITAEDVLWTYQVIVNPKNMTGAHKVSMERFQPPVIIDPYTIRFTAKEVHWVNLGAAGGFQILPKHVFESLDFNKINFEFPVVSGRYQLGEFKEGLYVTLERRKEWWDQASKRWQGTGNFQTLKFKFFAESENAYEAFKKGMIDLFPVYMSRIWVNETSGEKFDMNWIVKQRIYNSKPVGFQGFAMNMRGFPLDDILVRQALAHLLDREKMNKTLMYSQYFLHRSFFEDLYDKSHPCSNPVIDFNKDRARDLLKQAGWKANPQTGFLEKNGKIFSLKFLSRDASTDKFLAIYGEDLKDVGIQLVVDKKDWAAWAKDMDEFNYQMTWAAWGSGIFKDPESMWSSAEAIRKGGNNITGFKHTEVDKLIEKQRSIFDVSARNEICKHIDQIIYQEFPYVLLWNINYTRLLYWNKFGMPDTVLSKYGDESSCYWYWWLDEDSVADLNDALKQKRPLPQKPSVVNFDEQFKGNAQRSRE